MKNSTRYLLSHLATRLGIAAFYSSMHLHPAGCEMPPEQKRTPAACVSSIHLEAAQGFLATKGMGGWRCAGKGVSEMTFAFPKKTRVNTLVLREAGSHIRHFALECWKDGAWLRFYESDKVERYRYCSFPAQQSTKYRLLILKTWGAAKVTECSFYDLSKQHRQQPFRVSAYMRFDTEEFLAFTQKERDAFSRHFETVNEVILFDTLKWSKGGAVWFNYRDASQTNEEAKQTWFQHAAEARKVIEKSGRPVKVLASFFQPGKDTVESLENHMEPLIEALTAFLREAKLDGIEFDWEFPKGKREWALFSKFLVNLKQRLMQDGRILAVALASLARGSAGDRPALLHGIRHQRYKRLSRLLRPRRSARGGICGEMWIPPRADQPGPPLLWPPDLQGGVLAPLERRPGGLLAELCPANHF